MEQPAEVTAEDARKRFGELLNRVQWRGEHIVITRRGERAIALIPLDWYDAATNPTDTPPSETS